MLRLGTRPASTRTSAPVEVIAPSVSPDSTETETGTSCRLSSRRCAVTTLSLSPLSSQAGPPGASCAAAGAAQTAAARAKLLGVAEGKWHLDSLLDTRYSRENGKPRPL